MPHADPYFLTVACPKCAMAVGVRCITVGGLDFPNGHAERKTRAKRVRLPSTLKDDTLLVNVGLPTRAVHALRYAQCYTVADARACPDKRILNAINSGKTTLAEIRKLVGYAPGNGPDAIDPDARNRRYTVVMADPEAPDFTWTVHVWATTPKHAEAQAVAGTPEVPRVFAVFRGHLANLLPTVDESTDA